MWDQILQGARALQLLDKQQVECPGDVFTSGDFQQDWLPGLSFEGFLGQDDGGQDSQIKYLNW